ncbi:MAG: PKD domain-containing protein [Methanomassiliicoccales archaeon]|nr:MAG: PKD domain-containing protein [Methanomassiliicoccales archaeon]
MHMNRALVTGIILIFFMTCLSGCVFPRENLPPEPNLAASSTYINVNEKVIFSGNNSVDRDGEIVRYFWNFGDGVNATGPYVTHEYEEGGNYTVILIITDDDDKKAVQTITVHVNELPVPLIDITLPAYIHEPVYFWANDSYDPDGFVTGYHWDFGDGTNMTGMGVEHVYTEKKLFRVTLTVIDNDEAKAASSLEFEIQFRTYLVEWVIENVIVKNDSGLLEEEESELLERKINVFNMTKVMFNLTWTDNIPYVGDPPLAEPEPNDEFLLNVTSPDEDMYEEGPSVSEQIKLYAPDEGKLNPIPPSFEQEAESKEKLKILLAENYTTSGGTGEWEVNITLLEAGAAIDNPLPEDLDLGEDWVLEIVSYYYFPVITKL